MLVAGEKRRSDPDEQRQKQALNYTLVDADDDRRESGHGGEHGEMSVARELRKDLVRVIRGLLTAA